MFKIDCASIYKKKEIVYIPQKEKDYTSAE